MNTRPRISLGIAFLACMAASAVFADGFDLSWHTIDGGGGTSSGGVFELSGTAGQPDAGVLTGGEFTLTGGFWPGASTSPCTTPGDLDGDGAVGLSDLATLLAHFGTTSGAVSADGDLDGDGDVDLEDLAGLLAGFGTSCP